MLESKQKNNDDLDVRRKQIKKLFLKNVSSTEAECLPDIAKYPHLKLSNSYSFSNN
ncbi:MAG: hypothetical protein AB1782_13265 [Cyanobacteriota bacterium]